MCSVEHKVRALSCTILKQQNVQLLIGAFVGVCVCKLLINSVNERERNVMLQLKDFLYGLQSKRKKSGSSRVDSGHFCNGCPFT